MDRRTFLTLAGGGVLGGAVGRASARTGGETDPSLEDPGPLEGQVALPNSGLQQIVWSVDTDTHALALTFDDGPDPAFTPRILELLDRHGFKATFFAMGYNATHNPSLLREVVAAGHEIGSHGWAHLNLMRTTPEDTYEEIDQGRRAVEDQAQVPVKLFRPPYGRFDEATVRFLATRRDHMIVWSQTRGELTWTDPAQIASHVAGSSGPGDIVMLHDGVGRATFNPRTDRSLRIRSRREVELNAMPEILDRIEQRGLKPLTVTQLMAKATPEDPGA